jgi:tol-pal system protein YbgF
LIRNRFTIAALVASFLVPFGCATQSDMQFLRDDIRQARTQAADAQATSATLRRDLDMLRGDIEALKFQTGSGAKTEELVSRLSALEARLALLEQNPAAAAPGIGTAPGVGPEEGALVSPPPSSVGGEAVPGNAPAEYREAFALLRANDFQGAIGKFREFLRRSPKSDLADNAQYWIGESYYGMRDFNRAILEFNEVLLRYPKGDKVPAALLRQASAFSDLGDKVDARLVLQKLVSEHGGTPEAEQGRQKLAELSQ